MYRKGFISTYTVNIATSGEHIVVQERNGDFYFCFIEIW